jgi:DNA-binding transcriptional regulator LsrR (DeoR family)
VSRARSADTLVRAAQLYYVERRSQAEVARDLGTSRPNVSRMLAEAQRQGIVEVRINDPAGRCRDLEGRLERTFGLTVARVARRSAGQDAAGQVGALGATLLVESLVDGMDVGLSWGHALQALVHRVEPDHDHDVTLLQLLGGVSGLGNEVSGQELVRTLAGRLGARYRLLHAPATLQSAEARRALTAETSVADALAAARAVQLALVGVGTPRSGSSAAVVDSLALTEAAQEDFWAAGPVGDLAGRFYGPDGTPLTGPVDDRVVGVTLGELGRVEHVVGVVSGRDKTQAVLGALRGHHLDSLVCDEGLARALLDHGGPTGRSHPLT